MNPKFKKAIYLSIAVVAAIAIFDIIAAHSNVFGTIEDYTLGNYINGWWDVFYSYNLILLTIIPICYYFFARRDISESIALFLNGYILWFFGLADALYFIFQFKMIPQDLPWLNGHLIIGWFADIIGSGQVTRTALVISIAVGFFAIYSIDKFLEKI